ncbi:hypothetical protein [Telluribacter sp. SYSU D00476]|uniref:hypothetical protein n=1 Tax=Telluribacter sp. SYSU D00476 TaxID=2811430 RepID=UPI001FF3A520|nr:hypothetical protein [Telluribacter sp. SYSU D00476]
MKNLFKTLICLSLIAGFGTTKSQAQSQPATGHYHWVVEVSKTDAVTSTFRIYHNQDQLVYEETLKDKSLDIRKRTTRRKLDKALHTYVASAQQLAKLNQKTLLQSLAVR